MGDRFAFMPIGEHSQNLEDSRDFEHEFKIERLKMPDLNNKYAVTLISGEVKTVDAACVNDILDSIPKEQIESIQALKSLNHGLFHRLDTAVEEKVEEVAAEVASTPLDAAGQALPNHEPEKLPQSTAAQKE